MAEDDYDLLPHKEIVKLRNEVKELRKALGEKAPEKPIKESKAEEVKPEPKKPVTKDDMTPSIEKLTESINSLLELFRLAGEEMKADEHKPQKHFDEMNIHLDNLNDKMNTLIQHNEEIAKGILVVADMMKEHLPAINDNTKTTRQHVEKRIAPRPMPMQRPVRRPAPPPMPRPAPVQGPRPMQKPPAQPLGEVPPFEIPPPPSSAFSEADFPESPMPLGQKPKPLKKEDFLI